jgi:hypothetical protein
MAYRKILLGLGCAAVLSLLHAGCGGLVGAVCQRDCDCQQNCDHNSESICEQDALDVQAKIDAAGCDTLYNSLLECELTTSCRGAHLDVTKCQAKNDAVQACLDKHAAGLGE